MREWRPREAKHILQGKLKVARLFTRENGSPLSGVSAWWFDSSEGMVKLGVGPKQVADTLDQRRALAFEVEAGVRARIAEARTSMVDQE